MGSEFTRIKVLHVINDLSVGGAETMLYKLLSTIDRKHFDPAVVSLGHNGGFFDSIRALDIPVYALGGNGPRSFAASLWRLVRLINRVQPDVIQGWLPHSNLLTLIASKFSLKRVPVIWNIRHSIESLAYEKRATRTLVKLCALISHYPAAIVYNSQNGASQHENIGYDVNKRAVIYNGFDTKLFASSSQTRESFRSELNFSTGTFLIGLVSRFHAVKNHANFLAAASEIRKKRDDVQFVMCGSGIIPENESLSKLIDDLELQSVVHLLGERADMPRVTAGLDVAVSSSFSEGFPNSIGEAMSCGVPCVVTDVGDLGWIVENAGIPVPNDDPVAMANAFDHLLNMDEEQRSELGQNGRARVMEHFCLSAIAQRYATLYESVMAKSVAADAPSPLNIQKQTYPDTASTDSIKAAV